MRILPLSEFRASASATLDLVERGEVVRILRHGKPVADLVPIRPEVTAGLPAWKRRDFDPLLLPPGKVLVRCRDRRARQRSRDGKSADVRILLDTSALVKRYALEAGRERVVALAESASELCVAAHCKVEVASALCRCQSEGSLDSSGAERTWARVQQEFMEMTVVPLSAAVEDHTVAVLLETSLRGCDAIHIGSALAARVDLFVTADPRQARAAQHSGLATELIEAAGVCNVPAALPVRAAFRSPWERPGAD